MKIVASDYDGTLRVNGVVSQEDIQAIVDFRKQGNAFGIVTGRSTQTLKIELETYNLPYDFVVCNNGGVILDASFQQLKVEYLPMECIGDLLSFVESKGATSYTLNDGHQRSRVILKDVVDDFFARDDKGIAPEALIKQGKIAQVIAVTSSQEAATQLQLDISERFGLYADSFVNLGCVDIVPKGVSKANGLASVVSLNHYNANDVYAIGDSFNDISMLEVYQGSALSHSVSEVKEHATYVFDSVGSLIQFIQSSKR